MKSANDNLVVRQHDRVACRLSAMLAVSGDQQSKVVLARTAGDGNRCVRVSIVDVSTGGLALESPVFIPKGCRLDVRVDDGEGGREGAAAGGTIVMTIRVQRAAMLDRTPLYYLGGAFVSDAPDHRELVERLLRVARRSATPAASGDQGGKGAAVA